MIPADDPPRATALEATPLVLAALASAGAGLVSAGAAGARSDHRALATVLAVAAAVQLGWAALALVRPARSVAAVGVAVNLGATGFWLLATTSSAGLAHTLLAMTAVGGAGWALGEGTLPAPLRATWATPAVAVVVLALAFSAVVGDSGSETDEAETASEPSSPDTSAVVAVEPLPTTAPPDNAGDHDHADPSGPVTSLYDPRVTPEQRAAAQALIDDTTAGMERFPDIDSVLAEGYLSIGDGLTGYEHFVHIGHIADGVDLDPTRIESIVARVEPDGAREVVSAMYILSPGATMDDVPDIAGPLTTWHDHQDLCWQGVRVVATTRADGSCPRGEFRGTAPMLHVWLVPHPCGPFAGIEGGHGDGCAHDEH